MWPKSHRRNPPSRRDVAALAATAGASPAPSEGNPHPGSPTPASPAQVCFLRLPLPDCLPDRLSPAIRKAIPPTSPTHLGCSIPCDSQPQQLTQKLLSRIQICGERSNLCGE
ncbi:hypothetical protein GQR58_007757 [Nymphon striatum]|nr:hypothetical protein GQR58_007757 [Nymphon striatum]